LSILALASVGADAGAAPEQLLTHHLFVHLFREKPVASNDADGEGTRFGVDGRRHGKLKDEN